jgi:hypothetical protein
VKQHKNNLTGPLTKAEEKAISELIKASKEVERKEHPDNSTNG